MKWVALSILVSLLTACAEAQRPDPPYTVDRRGDFAAATEMDPGDLAPTADLGAGADLAAAADLALGAADLAQGAGDLASLTPQSCHVLLNELTTGTSEDADREYVEIYNPCAQAASIAGWRLIYRAASGTSDVTMASLTGSLASDAYLLVASDEFKLAFTGTVDVRLVQRLSKTGGGLALYDAQNDVVDAVGWGTATNLYVEGAAAAAPASTAMPGSSIGRLRGAADTDRNDDDWHPFTATPGAANPASP